MSVPIEVVKCPTSGYSCVDKLVSRVDIIAAHTASLVELFAASGEQIHATVLNSHMARLAEWLVEVTEEYCADHGEPPLMMHIESAHWLVTKVAS